MRVGSDLEAICKKCGDVWHVVIALAARRIAKVECKECGARHRYRAVKGEIGAVRGKPAARATSSRTRSGKKKQPVRADESRPRRDFRMSDTYEVGDRLLHASFGEGVVQEVAGPAKIVVLFDVGSKTLVHGRRGK
jgi:predicted nucleic acid-binding Zn ribbon protein